MDSTSPLHALRATVEGVTITPDDTEYASAKDAFIYIGHPLAIVKARGARDIQATLSYAKANRLTLSVRSGGHSLFGTNDGGIVLDLSSINTIERIGDSTVRIGAGATWIEVADQLGEWGLALSSGDSTSVGVGGLTTGGGIGWMVRKYGLAIDSLIAADVVTADGTTHHASQTENKDLFWAIRGGGGNFGIVTHFEFEAHENRGVFAGTITYSRDETQEVLTKWRDYMRRAPDELTVIINIMPAFGEERPALLLSFCYAGTDEVAALQAINPLLSLGTIINKEVAQKAYKDVLEEAHAPKGARVIVNNAFVNNFSDDVIDMMSREGVRHDMIIQIRGLGGAMSRITEDATAFAHRKAEVLVVCPVFIESSATSGEIEKQLAPWYNFSAFSDGSYVNLLSEPTEHEARAVYPLKTLQRLEEIKAIYDPNNIFNQNHNIKPGETHDT